MLRGKLADMSSLQAKVGGDRGLAADQKAELEAAQAELASMRKLAGVYAMKSLSGWDVL